MVGGRWDAPQGHIHPPHQFLTHHHPVQYSLYIQETHHGVHTNKPRALLMQQALYNEPKRARLLWENGMSVQTLSFTTSKKTSSPFYHSPWICMCPIIPPPFEIGRAHRYTRPTLASHSSIQLQCQFCVTHGQRHRLSDPAKDLGNNFSLHLENKIHFSGCMS